VDAGGGSSRMPASVITQVLGGTTYYRVTFTNGCTFSSRTAWQIGGRYEPGDPGSQFKKVTSAWTSSSGPTGGIDGCYSTAANSAWIRKYWSGESGDELNYVYLLYCCPT
jgi:hypothetical protein